MPEEIKRKNCTKTRTDVNFFKHVTGTQLIICTIFWHPFFFISVLQNEAYFIERVRSFIHEWIIQCIFLSENEVLLRRDT